MLYKNRVTMLRITMNTSRRVVTQTGCTTSTLNPARKPTVRAAPCAAETPRIACFVLDTLIAKSIYGSCDDEAVQQHSNLKATDEKPYEAPQTETYIVAGASSEQFEDNYGWPPKDGD